MARRFGVGERGELAMTVALVAALVFVAACFAVEIMRVAGVWRALRDWWRER